ncbi:helix-turn-helix domain-containing protein, partial [Streptosporangium roseum]|uniref:helix-turn-helix domain-containing protein n=1 Tax=Streptosporangium roseum TaxID=2001 RepID=UPI001E2F4040
MTAALLDRVAMTVAESALLLGVHRDAAYDAVHRGELPAIRVGRAIRIPPPRSPTCSACPGRLLPTRSSAPPATSGTRTNRRRR